MLRHFLVFLILTACSTDEDIADVSQDSTHAIVTSIKNKDYGLVKNSYGVNEFNMDIHCINREKAKITENIFYMEHESRSCEIQLTSFNLSNGMKCLIIDRGNSSWEVNSSNSFACDDGLNLSFDLDVTTEKVLPANITKEVHIEFSFSQPNI